MIGGGRTSSFAAYGGRGRPPSTLARHKWRAKWKIYELPMQYPLAPIPDRAKLSPILAERANWIRSFNQPPFESPKDKLWYFLQRRQLNGFRFRKDRPLGNGLVADFHNHELRLIVLVNSHCDAQQLDNMTMIAVAEHEITTDLPSALQRILIAACQRAGKKV